jgi:hypothetical protein
MATSFQVTFDCKDPAALAAFWAEALGYVPQPPPAGFDSWESWATSMEIPEENWNDVSALIDPDGLKPRLYFQRVPEGKTAKNRVHLDVNLGGDPASPIEERQARVEAAVERLVAAGATRSGTVDERGAYWVVMQDPEGNEFCVE